MTFVPAALLSVLALGLFAPPAAAQRAVFIVGEDEYGSERTIPEFARELASRTGVGCKVVHSENRRLPLIDEVARPGDVLVLFLRFREASEQAAAQLERWIGSGGPVLALRTTSHALVGDKGWFPPRFGGHYKGHADNRDGTFVVCNPRSSHPILRGVPRAASMGRGGTYNAQPLADGAEVLLFGRSGELPCEPVAWVYEPAPGMRRFYTSLGSREHFEQPALRVLLANAVLWALDREVPAGGALGGDAAPAWREPALPPPPPLAAPPDATVLFGGADLSAWRHWDPGTEPRAIRIDERADTTAGGPMHDAPRWHVEDRALVARSGFGDLLTREEHRDYHLHLDFLIPPEPAWFPDDFRGASGVYLSGRYEIQLVDSFEKDTTKSSCGALYGVEPPLVNAAAPPGTWQRLDVTYTHPPDGPPRISAWLNDRLVLDDVRPQAATALGFLAPVPGSVAAGEARFVGGAALSAECDFGARSWAVVARFRSRGSGTLVSKCPAEGEWVPDAKALFLRGGRLVYDIGWVGALTSRSSYDDGEWHTVVLTSDDRVARMYVDGGLQAERADFGAGDEEHFRIKVGAANSDFGGVYDGQIAEARFYARRVPPDAAEALSAAGAEPGFEPAFAWTPEEDTLRAPPPGENLRGPVRLQADCSPVRFANVWLRPLEAVDHAGLIRASDEAAYARGREIYGGLCVACHGADGTRPTNPQARPFVLGVLENGSDPLSLFRTVTSGFKEMPSNEWLTPRQRYDVIHYVREEFLRERNESQYFAVDDAYLNALPKGRPPSESEESELVPRDYGPALGAQLGPDVGAGLAVRLDHDTTLGYDLQTMESPGTWTGGFLELSRTHHYQQRGEGIAAPKGRMLAGLAGYGFGHEGTLDWDRSQRPERGPLPGKWLDYRGYHVHGDDVVLTYAIDGRHVLEQPGVDRSAGLPVISHRLSIGPGGRELVLNLCGAPGDPGSARALAGESSASRSGSWKMRGLANGGRFAAAATVGIGGPELDEAGRVFLRIPPSEERQELWVLRTAGDSEAELAGFRTFLDNVLERPFPTSPRELTRGGPARWSTELVTRGALGEETGGYALDTVALPASNPWNAWLRTSALDFFDDGRAAVSTYGGDVWIVSGLDEELKEVRWRRFAAGLFEPMGLRVLEGLVYVTCRDRIVRLGDLDDDGEADVYESFFADPDVTASFHSFNFDLQTDADGFFYYAKSGQYTDFALPGAVLKVTPDGREHEVYCTGLRTPNGMGMSPDGRPLVSDNQGNWVPASKVSLTRPGGFYGVFESIDTNGPGIQTRGDFDRPAVWLPQGLDSSSGGQLWVDDPRFGPLSGRYLHTSFGKGWMYVLMIEDGDPPQGGVYRFPWQFEAGIQRLRVNPADGAVYTVGLSGWQGPAGGKDGCFQRVRYTGGEGFHLLATRVLADGVELEFDRPLDAATAEERSLYAVRRWNYRWARSYGSAHYSLDREGEEGEDVCRIRRVELSRDGTRVRLGLDDMRPVDQLVVECAVRSESGEVFAREVYLTVNRVPEAGD